MNKNKKPQSKEKKEKLYFLEFRLNQQLYKDMKFNTKEEAKEYMKKAMLNNKLVKIVECS